VVSLIYRYVTRGLSRIIPLDLARCITALFKKLLTHQIGKSVFTHIFRLVSGDICNSTAGLEGLIPSLLVFGVKHCSSELAFL
jgi:hypothetical protein